MMADVSRQTEMLEDRNCCELVRRRDDRAEHESGRPRHERDDGVCDQGNRYRRRNDKTDRENADLAGILYDEFRRRRDGLPVQQRR